MAATARWFSQAGGLLITRLWVPQTMHVALMKATYVPDGDTQLRYSDISAQELATAGGYTAGGKPILNKSTSYDASGDEYNMLGDDVIWGPGVTFSTRYAVIYEQSTTDKFLWEIIDHGQQMDIINGYFTVDFASGILSVVAGPAV